MAVINPPIWLQAGSYTAQQDRRLLSTLVGAGEGVVEPLGMLVTQRGAGANMSVDVADGRAFVNGDEATYQGAYHVENQGTTNVVVSAAHATLPRRDIVVARVRDAQYSGATNAWALEVVAGTPNASPSDPAIPASAIPLARIAVAAAATSITNAVITDLRTRARFQGTVAVVTSTTLPSLLSTNDGDMAWATDTDTLYVMNGTAWVPVSAARTVTFSGSSFGSLSLTNLASATITLPPGRWDITCKGVAVDTVGNRQADFQLWDSTGAAQLDLSNIFVSSPFRIPFLLNGVLSNTSSKTVTVRGMSSSVSGSQTVENARLTATAVSAFI